MSPPPFTTLWLRIPSYTEHSHKTASSETPYLVSVAKVTACYVIIATAALPPRTRFEPTSIMDRLSGRPLWDDVPWPWPTKTWQLKRSALGRPRRVTRMTPGDFASGRSSSRLRASVIVSSFVAIPRPPCPAKCTP